MNAYDVFEKMELEHPEYVPEVLEDNPLLCTFVSNAVYPMGRTVIVFVGSGVYPSVGVRNSCFSKVFQTIAEGGLGERKIRAAIVPVSRFLMLRGHGGLPQAQRLIEARVVIEDLAQREDCFEVLADIWPSAHTRGHWKCAARVCSLRDWDERPAAEYASELARTYAGPRPLSDLDNLSPYVEWLSNRLGLAAR